METKRSKTDVIPYVTVLVLAGALFVAAGDITSMGGAQRAIGPAFWPRLILGLAMCVCVFEIGFRWFFDMEGMGGLLSQVSGELEKIEGAAADEPATYHSGRLAAGVGLTLLYVGILPVMGFATASLLYIGLFIWLGNYRRLPVVIAVSLVGTLALVFIFMKVVYVSLPLGSGIFGSLSVLLMQLMGIH